MSYAALAQLKTTIRGPKSWTSDLSVSDPLLPLCSGTQSCDTGSAKAELNMTELSFELLLLEWVHKLSIT